LSLVITRQYSTNKTKLKQLRIKRLERVVSAIAVRKIPVLSPGLTSSIVYQATVTRNDTKEEKTYVGHTEGEFKTRYSTMVTPVPSETPDTNMLLN
jgi:hypothetical protein